MQPASSAPVPVPSSRWNSNLHAFAQLIQEVPPHAQRGLDVGCGEGETARMLRQRVPAVVGVDPHEASVNEARSYSDDIEYLVGSLDTVDLARETFDVVTAVAMLHHVDHRSALRRLAGLVAPAGILIIVGLARSQSLSDYARDARDAVTIRRHTFTKSVWDTSAPKIWPPPLSYSQARAATDEVLPDARFGRVPYFRFGVTWVKNSN